MSKFPDPGYPRRAIEDALVSWLEAGAGLDRECVTWSDGGVVNGKLPLGVLTWVSSTPIGIAAHGVESLIADELLSTYPDGTPDVRIWSGQPHAVLLSVQVFASPKASPQGLAEVRLAAACARLNSSIARSALRTAGLVVLRVGSVRNVGAGQAQVDLSCEVAVNVSDDITSIQRVTFAPTLNTVALPTFDAPTSTTAPPALPRVFFGSAVSIANSSDVLAHLDPIDVAGLPLSLSLSVAIGERGFVVLPVSFAADTFTVNGFVGGFVPGATFSVNSVPMIVWATAFQSLGSFVVEVST